MFVSNGGCSTTFGRGSKAVCNLLARMHEQESLFNRMRYILAYGKGKNVGNAVNAITLRARMVAVHKLRLGEGLPRVEVCAQQSI